MTEPADSGAASARDYAIVIGIDRYPGLGQPLSGAVGDATDFHKWLCSRSGARVPEDQAKLIVSPRKGRARPVHDEIDETFDRFLDAAARRGARRLYVYFAGHGYSVRANHVNLLLANATRRLLNRGLDASKYHDVLLASPFDEQVFLYDCCRTFDARAHGLGPQFLYDEAPAPDLLREVARVILYAVQVGRQSTERTTREARVGGLFTRVLLEGLGGGAAMRRDDRYVVTTASLREFMKTRLEQLADAEGLLQRPDFQPLRDDELVLAEDVEPWMVAVILRSRRPGTEAILVRGNQRPPSRVPVKDGVARLQLPPGLYSADSVPDGGFLPFEVRPGKPLDEVLGT